MASLLHLAGRFVTSLPPTPPRRADRRWAEEQLLSDEVRLWRRLSNADQRHSVGVARRVAAALGPTTERSVVAAALLHDCGKVVSGFGPFRRVIATLVALVFGHERTIASTRGRRGFVGRIADYLDHPRLGADLLTRAGSAPLTVAWAAEHHLPATDWSVPVEIGAALRDADDD